MGNRKTPLEAVGKLSDERHAQLTVSTGQRAKGREWNTVCIADGFYEPGEDDDRQPNPIDDANARLSHVAVTRARMCHGTRVPLRGSQATVSNRTGALGGRREGRRRRRQAAPWRRNAPLNRQ